MMPDPVGAWLMARGYDVYPYFLSDTAFQLGWQFTYKGCELSWRCEGRRIWIVMFRRCEARAGLSNPFTVLYVLAQAVLSVFGPGYSLYGNVQVLAGSPLAAAKLGRFYTHWTGAQEPERGWFELDVSRVCSLKTIRKRQKDARY